MNGLIEPHEDVLLAGILPVDETPENAAIALENLRFLTEQIDVDLLPQQHGNIISCAGLYASDTDWTGALTQQGLLAFLLEDQASSEVIAQYVMLYCRAALKPVTQAAFRFAVKQFVRVKRSESYAEILAVASTIRTTGAKVGKVELKGYQDSVTYLRGKLGELQDDGETEEAGGDFREEAPEVEAEYQERKTDPEAFIGWKCGIDTLDNLTNGAHGGELHFLCGAPRSGKSFFVRQWSLFGSIQQKMNIAIFSTEMPKEQYRRCLALRHLRDIRFGTPSGIDSERFRSGKLTPNEEQALKLGTEDLRDHKEYGRIYIFKIPTGKGLEWIESKLVWLNILWNKIGGVHGAVIDSLNQVATGVAIDQTRLGLSALVRNTKQLALNFDQQRGITIVATWHANRKSHAEAVERGGYVLGSWTETGEVEMSGDSVSWLLRIPNQADRHEVLFGNDKHRDSRDEVRATLYEDFGSGYLGLVQNSHVPADPLAKTGAYNLY